jgi:uncharacterized damage-inducible protein DinB
VIGRQAKLDSSNHEVIVMSRSLRIATAALFATCLAGPLAAQDAAKKAEPPKPAGSPTEALLGAWNYEHGKIVAMAEDFPADKYDFKPNPAQRSFAEQLLHVAGAAQIVVSAATGQPVAEADPPRDKFKTKAEVVAVLKKAVEEGAAAIKARGDAGLRMEFRSPWGNYMTRLSDFVYGMVVHAGEHYGQLVVYYRVNNLVPPESRPR